jgi:hypothetical protein
MPEPADPTLPPWARVLDAAGLALIVLGISVLFTGGFREWTPLGRLSVTSPVRPLVLAAVLLLLRHFVQRQPSVVSRAAGILARARHSVTLQAVWPIVFASRLGVLAIGFLGIALLGYAPNTPPYRIYNNDLLDMPARWDTGWYMGIATSGYAFDPAATEAMQNIAFFPLYPMLMHYVAAAMGRHVIWAGVAISCVAFLWAAIYLYKFATTRLDAAAAATAVALLAAYPFALFFSAAYTESLFLLTIVATCFHFERDQLWKASAWGLAAGLTRPNGCFLSIVLALVALRDYPTASWRDLARRVMVAATPGIGMLIFSIYIYTLTGNPFQWAAQHAAWGRMYRGVGALVTDRLDFIQTNGLYDYASTMWLDMINVGAVVFALGSVWPVYRRFGIPYAALILVNVLPPLSFGGVLSMGRLTSVLFPTFLWLGAVIPANQRSSWLVGFAMLQALFAVAFFTWRPLY